MIYLLIKVTLTNSFTIVFEKFERTLNYKVKRLL